MKKLRTITTLLISVIILISSVYGASDLSYVSVMDKTKVIDIQIIADEAEWQNMLDTATEENYISATIIINGETIEKAGIRPKGNSSLSMVARDDTTDRFSFKIEFDHYVSGQTWLGLDKIVVNNMQGDATYMKEYFAYDILNYIGVATPLYAFSDITVNGEKWGFYLAIEALEDSYAERVYGEDHGKLYKPESDNMNMDGGNTNPQPIINNRDGSPPEMNENRTVNPSQGGFGGRGGFGGMSGSGVSLQYTDDEIASYSAIFDNAVFKSKDSDYQRVIESLKKLSAGEDLDQVVDIEATLKYFAAHTVSVNGDSYISNMGHNYYLYEKDGQLTMLPWDYNLAFGGFQSGGASEIVNFPIDTPVSGISLEERPILAKLLEVPEYMELYHSYLQEIVDGYPYTETLTMLEALISPYVESDPTAFYDYEAYQKGVIELEKLITLRMNSIEGQLDGTIPSTTAGQSADPESLIDVSGIDLSALGSMGGMGGFGGERGGNGMGDMRNFNMENMQRAMEIMQSAGDGELTEDQLKELEELGFTEEQINMFGNNTPRQGGGQRQPMEMEIEPQSPPEPEAEIEPEIVSEIIPEPLPETNNYNMFIIIGICTALMFMGLFIVLFYKRKTIITIDSP